MEKASRFAVSLRHLPTQFILRIASFIFLWGVGALLHFAYRWSSQNLLIGMFGCVNESVWEHLKMVFWPWVFWSLGEYSVCKTQIHNFILGKIAQVTLSCFFVIAVFYSYTFFTQKSIFAVDILTFSSAIALGQLADIKARRIKLTPDYYWNTAMVCIVALVCTAFMTFTFDPPRTAFFQDPVTGSYGVTLKR